MDTRTLQFYFDKAKSAKDSVRPVYNQVLEFTDSTYQIMDSATKNFVPKEIDSVIPVALNDLVSFLMTSMFSRSSKWATLRVNEKLYQLTNGDEADYLVGGSIEKLNKELEAISDVTFTYLNQSNYYNEIAKALREAVNVGVGCYRITETPSAYTPFLFQYVPLDDLFFWENAHGKPHYIFRYLRNMNQTALNVMFGEGVKFPKDLKTPDIDMMTLLETVVPGEKEGTFLYRVFTEDLRVVVYEKVLNYCPIVIFRWMLEGTNPYGIGLGTLGLKIFKELKDLKAKRNESAEKLLNPPIFLRGDRSLAMSLSLEASAVNYGGTMSQTGMGLSSDVRVETIQTVGGLLPLDNDIHQKYAEIRELFSTNPLGRVEDFKRRTSREVEARLQALRNKWAISYEIMQSELLAPAFITPLKVLVDHKRVEFSIDDLDTTMINYRNALALSQDVQSVEMISMYMSQAMQVAQSAEQVGLNSSRVLTYFQDNLGVPIELRLTEEEMNGLRQQLQEQQMMAQQNAMMQQQEQLGMQQPEPGMEEML